MTTTKDIEQIVGSPLDAPDLLWRAPLEEILAKSQTVSGLAELAGGLDRKTVQREKKKAPGLDLLRWAFERRRDKCDPLVVRLREKEAVGIDDFWERVAIRDSLSVPARFTEILSAIERVWLPVTATRADIGLRGRRCNPHVAEPRRLGIWRLALPGGKLRLPGSRCKVRSLPFLVCSWYEPALKASRPGALPVLVDGRKFLDADAIGLPAPPDTKKAKDPNLWRNPVDWEWRQAAVFAEPQGMNRFMELMRINPGADWLRGDDGQPKGWAASFSSRIRAMVLGLSQPGYNEWQADLPHQLRSVILMLSKDIECKSVWATVKGKDRVDLDACDRLECGPWRPIAPDVAMMIAEMRLPLPPTPAKYEILLETEGEKQEFIRSLRRHHHAARVSGDDDALRGYERVETETSNPRGDPVTTRERDIAAEEDASPLLFAKSRQPSNIERIRADLAVFRMPGEWENSPGRSWRAKPRCRDPWADKWPLGGSGLPWPDCSVERFDRSRERLREIMRKILLMLAGVFLPPTPGRELDVAPPLRPRNMEIVLALLKRRAEERAGLVSWDSFMGATARA